METIKRTERRRKNRTSTFYAVSVYQNLPAGKCAKRFYDQLSHQFREDFVFKHTMWNFSVLSLAEVRQEAIESIESADLVVLSFDNAGLPNTDMQKWEDILDILLELSAKNKPALATIYNRDGAMEFTDAAHSYLSSFSMEKRGGYLPEARTIYAS